MPRTRSAESDEQRDARLKRREREANEHRLSAEAALDAMVQRSIALYGA